MSRFLCNFADINQLRIMKQLKSSLSRTLLLLSFIFASNVSFGYTRQELKEFISIMTMSVNENSPVTIAEGIELEGMTYDGLHNEIVMKYLISNPSVFKFYLETPHEDLQASTIQSLSIMIKNLDEASREIAIEAFGQINPHFVARMSNGRGTTVKCEFDGKMLVSAANTSTLPEQDSRTYLANQVKLVKKQLPMRADNITVLTDIYLDRQGRQLVFVYDIEGTASFKYLSKNPSALRQTIQQGLNNSPMLPYLIEAGYGMKYIYRCKQDPSLSPIKYTFSVDEIKQM